MNDTLLGIVIAGVVIWPLQEAIKWVMARVRNRAEVRQIEQTTKRDDFQVMIFEWKAVWAAKMSAAQSRHANQLEDWLRRAKGCIPNPDRTDEISCVKAEIAAEIERLRLEGIA